MKFLYRRICGKWIFQIIMLFSAIITFGQNTPSAASKSEFWRHVQFGGAFALNFGTGYTEITLAPGAIYNFNPYFAMGAGLQGTYISSKNSYDSSIYGANFIALFNPMDQIQVSTELEELHIHSNDFTYSGVSVKNDYWNTALFLGLGYRNQNVTVGVRYNVLFNPNKSVYSDAFMPFVRVYF